MKIAFIGCGNMGKAMIHGVLKSNQYKKNDVLGITHTEEQALQIKEEFGIETSHEVKKALVADYIFLTVKPNVYHSILQQISEFVEDQVIISVTPFFTFDQLEGMIGKKKIARIMPNTAAMVFESMSAYCVNDFVSDVQKERLKNILQTFGLAQEVKEEYFSAVVAISGSAPAYFYKMIDAMADAGVSFGLKRDQAIELATQTMLGSAKMLLETKKHPAVLKDEVASPGGSTIEAIKELDRQGFSKSIIQAMEACYNKVEQ